jgi:predicted nucleic acid-binding protein
MNILVDTTIWSLALRRERPQDPSLVRELTELIQELRVRLIGPIRQELLSGIKTEAQFQELRVYLSAFPDLPISTADYERAAEFFNLCRRKGIQGSNTDFLICAVAHHHGLEIYTTDKDFLEYSQYLPVKLYNNPISPKL